MYPFATPCKNYSVYTLAQASMTASFCIIILHFLLSFVNLQVDSVIQETILSSYHGTTAVARPEGSATEH